MTDLRQTIAPKSDQLNADDLIGQTRTIKITKVWLMGEPDQPIAIGFEGDQGKPYKPCKSMRRVMVQIWGPDGNAYTGRTMTLYRDDKVTFGALAVGGIRISHMSDIEKDVTMALTASKANRKPFTVRPMPRDRQPDKAPVAASAPPREPEKERFEVDEPSAFDPVKYAASVEALIDQASDAGDLIAYMDSEVGTESWERLKDADALRGPDIKSRAKIRVGVLRRSVSKDV